MDDDARTDLVRPIMRRRKLYRDVLDRLLARIKANEFPPGSRLPAERKLMLAYDVGRPAVREALQELQRMGLIVINHGDGARVVAPTARSMLGQVAEVAQHFLSSSPMSLDYLKEIRVFFEIGVVKLAAARSTPDHVETLRHCIADQAEAADDFVGFLQSDIQFHRTIARGLGNPLFEAVSGVLLELLSEYHVGLIRKLGREPQTLDEHVAIVDRIEAHDVEGAAAAMLSHLNRARDLYERRG